MASGLTPEQRLRNIAGPGPSDDQIHDYYVQYGSGDDIDLAAAMLLEEIVAPMSPCDSVTEGSVTLSKNTAMQRAQVYHKRAQLTNEAVIAQDAIRVRTLSRSDFGPDPDLPEYGHVV